MHTYSTQCIHSYRYNWNTSSPHGTASSTYPSWCIQVQNPTTAAEKQSDFSQWADAATTDAHTSPYSEPNGVSLPPLPLSYTLPFFIVTHIILVCSCFLASLDSGLPCKAEHAHAHAHMLWTKHATPQDCDSWRSVVPGRSAHGGEEKWGQTLCRHRKASTTKFKRQLRPHSFHVTTKTV